MVIEMEHSLAGIRGRCVAGTVRKEQSRLVEEEWEGRTVRAGGIMYSNIIPYASYKIKNNTIVYMTS